MAATIRMLALNARPIALFAYRLRFEVMVNYRP